MPSIDDSKSAAVLATLVVLLAPSCRSKPSVQEEEPSPVASSFRPAVASSGSKGPRTELVPKDEVERAVNPSRLPRYSGPQGTVRGVVRAAGPAPPPFEVKLKEIPSGKCDRARAMYGRLYREGPDRALADVLVAVTGYTGYLPPESPAVPVEARGCAFNTRTIVMTFGQHLAVRARDDQGLIPQLIGQRAPGALVAMPGGDPVTLTPTRVGQYALQDQAHPFATSDVFVLKYSTTDVTGLDGRFEIAGIPAGDVKVNVLLPITGQSVEKSVRVEEGAAIDLELVLEVDPQKYGSQGTGSPPTGAPDKPSSTSP